ncbi:unnamed protein product [Caenorhabditis angaria]|uniref:7TM GPCR serpentine receptor class x (Srx) domain-containing protein n=1 Tax=Caenorhabditis angaria TaxID=860376 RepID=A0A9P1N5X6_9PELO|nr:unnamed protein product [Caenorhabditis angaria]
MVVFRGSILVQETLETPEGCYFLYFVEILAWSTTPDKKCETSQSFLLTFTVFTLIGISVLNFLTFMKIILFYKTNSGNQDKVSRRKIRGNIKLFFQTLLQDSLFLIDLTSTFKLIGLYSNRIWTFICGSLIWQCLHSFDGFIMILFNGRLSFIKKHLWSSPSVTKMTTVTRTGLQMTVVQ